MELFSRVIFQDEVWEITSISIERRINGATFYSLRKVSNPEVETRKVNKKLCKPYHTGGILKGYEFGEMKTKPNEITEEQIDKAISESIVYQEAIKALREQVAYGLRKYPEPLNYKTWDFKESIRHALAENSDKQHYLTMMLINAEFLIHIDIVIAKLLQAYTSTDPLKVLHSMIYELQQKQKELETKFSPTRPID